MVFIFFELCLVGEFQLLRQGVVLFYISTPGELCAPRTFSPHVLTEVAITGELKAPRLSTLRDIYVQNHEHEKLENN